VIGNETFSVNDWLENINKVTKEEIVNVASKIELDTIYFLTGLEGTDDEKSRI